MCSPAKSCFTLKCCSGCWHLMSEIPAALQMKALCRLWQSPASYNGVFTWLKAAKFAFGVFWIRPPVQQPRYLQTSVKPVLIFHPYWWVAKSHLPTPASALPALKARQVCCLRCWAGVRQSPSQHPLPPHGAACSGLAAAYGVCLGQRNGKVKD